MPGKVTMKDLFQEVEKLQEINVEKDLIIKNLDDKVNNVQKWVQDLFSKFNLSEHTHFKNAEILDKKIVAIEEREKIEDERSEETKKPETSLENTLNKKCRECTLTFPRKPDLKKHILAVHPKSFACRICDNCFETSIDLEVHLNSHNIPKQFKCDVCEKTFHMNWRMEKHKDQHKLDVVKFCHFFNNNKFCSYEELGCMFKHTQAPLCNRSNRCQTKLCQFRHNSDIEMEASNEHPEDTDDKESNSEEENNVQNCKNFTHCGAKQNHPNDNIQNCSECDFNTKCWHEYNVHWQKTPGHIFSTDELREMGYDV